MSEDVEKQEGISKQPHEMTYTHNSLKKNINHGNIIDQMRDKSSTDKIQENSKKRRSLAINIGNGVSKTKANKQSLDNFPYHNKYCGIQHSVSSSVVFSGVGNTLPIRPVNYASKRTQMDFNPDHGIVGKCKQVYHQRNSLINPTKSHHCNPGINFNQDNTSNRPSYLKVQFSSISDKCHNKNKQKNEPKKDSDAGICNKSIAALQRSKSLSSADGLIYSFSSLGFGLAFDEAEMGQIEPEIKSLIKTALENPNKLNSRCLMELPRHFVKQAVEGRRYALPTSRMCFTIITKEQSETFLESLLNTCRQWYQERQQLLFAIQGMKNPSRLRLISFMAFLTEMFCKLKRRQLQLRIQYEGCSPPLVLLTLLVKCCEEIVKPPIKSLTEIECLFYVLTYTGSDLEGHLPQELEKILSMIRDAFLSTNDSPLSIRRTLLQLIELQASHWQLPGNTVLYYYPSGK